MKQLDLGVGQLDEHHGDAMRRLRLGALTLAPMTVR